MATRGAGDIAFDTDLRRAWATYENDNLDNCEELLRKMNNDPAVPRYHRVRALVMLASIVEPWVEANEFRLTAERLYMMVRTYHSEGNNPSIDRSLAELRGELDGLKTALDPDA